MGEAGTQSVATGVGIPYRLVSRDLVDRMHRHGFGVFAWTVDDESEMRRLVEAGVNGVVTNRPGAFAEVLRQLRSMSKAGG
jgi:glycerophosphoryl diester phosphodiesterase